MKRIIDVDLLSVRLYRPSQCPLACTKSHLLAFRWTWLTDM